MSAYTVQECGERRPPAQGCLPASFTVSHWTNLDTAQKTSPPRHQPPILTWVSATTEDTPRTPRGYSQVTLERKTFVAGMAKRWPGCARARPHEHDSSLTCDDATPIARYRWRIDRPRRIIISKYAGLPNCRSSRVLDGYSNYSIDMTKVSLAVPRCRT